ncbi:Eukaryotic translation initiation factor 4B3 [Dichanthelium oligosanthes]|uniref:Eukaryotic translation initiation factor 4B3 n=1 Tax=Dichanthelium oligosanthes TaxID=888268 RepID=A0A1E5VS71_9POAL|nr:Eukaryotic translation initiation factor 4B3 [Dichanthelium oligosanthes]
MAVASAWAKPGSWALAAEEQDELPPLTPPVVPAADFPDLATAATTKVPKKKKAQSIPLAEFNSSNGSKYVPRSSRGPGPEVMTLNLPTGPRERTEEELSNTRGFGAGRWGGAGGGPRGSDEPRHGGSDREDFGPSRADEADNWGAGKKPLERRERMGGFGGDSLVSRADDVVDWVSTKKTAPAPFAERRERVGGGFGGDSHSRADDSVSWVSNKSYSAPPPLPADGRRGGPVWGFNRDGGPDADSWSRKEEMNNGGAGRPRLNLQKRSLPLANGTDREKQEDSSDNKEDEREEQQPRSSSSNPFGAARPREEVLAAKGEDWRKEEPKVEKQEIQPRTKSSNPFGAARPREDVLAEKGEDWRKIDEKLEATKVWEALPERRSFGRRGSPVAGEENGNAQLSEARAERAWKKPDAVEAAKASEEGSDNRSYPSEL